VLFQADLFSISRPGWVTASKSYDHVLGNLATFLPVAFFPLLGELEQSEALGINSSNFRLSTSQGIFLLKQWSRAAKAADLKKTLTLMTWLATKELPVPAPIKFINGEVLLKLDSSTWSLFPFIEGNYFSGANGELEVAAQMTGRLIDVLAHVPSSCAPSAGPRHLTTADSKLLRRIEAASDQWDDLLGSAHAHLLRKCWPALMMEWEQLTDAGLDAGNTQASHFDLHPHNLLVKGDRVSAVLDFESCKLMPVGYALGFAALKQCRQTVALSQLPTDAPFVGARYIAQLSGCSSINDAIARRLGDFAVSEVIRRICLILKLNIENGDKTWNRVLPVQLGHIREARALFGYS
jgi:hypothetical protein